LVLPLVPVVVVCGVFGARSMAHAAASAAPAPRLVVERVLEGARGPQGWIRRWLTGSTPEPILDRPFAAEWDGEDLLVADPGSAAVVRIDARDRVRARTPAGMFASPIGIASCGGQVIVADSRLGAVLSLDRDLQHARPIAAGLGRPTGVACGGDRIFVVVTGEHRILEIQLATGEQRSLGRRGAAPGEFNFPTTIAVDGETILVGDTLNFRVQRLDRESGKNIQSFGRLGDASGETPRIKGLAVDERRRVWVSDSLLDQVAVFSDSGNLLCDFGGTGSEPGYFAFPAGIAAASDGRIAIVDSLNRRIQVVQIAGEDDASSAKVPR